MIQSIVIKRWTPTTTFSLVSSYIFSRNILLLLNVPVPSFNTIKNIAHIRQQEKGKNFWPKKSGSIHAVRHNIKKQQQQQHESQQRKLRDLRRKTSRSSLVRPCSSCTHIYLPITYNNTRSILVILTCSNGSNNGSMVAIILQIEEMNAPSAQLHFWFSTWLDHIVLACL